MLASTSVVGVKVSILAYSGLMWNLERGLVKQNWKVEGGRLVYQTGQCPWIGWERELAGCSLESGTVNGIDVVEWRGEQ